MRISWTTQRFGRGPDRFSPARAPFSAGYGTSIARLAHLDLAHRLVDSLLHAEGVGALAGRVFGEALQVGLEERPGRGRRPQFRGEKLAVDIAPFVGLRIHLLHRVHQQVEDVGYARIVLVIPPE